jgi:hypothetical protein
VATLEDKAVSSRVATDDRLDELYREPPDRFVAGRNALAKELRAGGRRDEAERVKALRRPSAAAWLINRVAFDSPELLEEFAQAGRAVAEAQNRALEGDEEAAGEWRAAAARERDATAAVADAAERLAQEAEGPVSRRALELVVETLRAAGGDPEFRDRVVRGRVERERSAATLGVSAFAPSPRRMAKTARTQRKRAAVQARRELKQLEDEVAAAAERQRRLAGRVEETAEALRREKAKLAESKRDAADLRRKLKAAERRARG